MTGYCLTCKELRDMTDIVTEQLRSLSYVHYGKCKQCNNRIVKKVKDKDIIINDAGHKFPVTVYVGKKTPDRLIRDQNGQTIMFGDKTLDTGVQRIFKTLREIMTEVIESETENKERVIRMFSLTGGPRIR